MTIFSMNFLPIFTPTTLFKHSMIFHPGHYKNWKLIMSHLQWTIHKDKMHSCRNYHYVPFYFYSSTDLGCSTQTISRLLYALTSLRCLSYLVTFVEFWINHFIQSVGKYCSCSTFRAYNVFCFSQLFQSVHLPVVLYTLVQWKKMNNTKVNEIEVYSLYDPGLLATPLHSMKMMGTNFNVQILTGHWLKGHPLCPHTKLSVDGPGDFLLSMDRGIKTI